MLVAIFKRKAISIRANVEKMVYANKTHRNTDYQNFTSTILHIAAMLVAILKLGADVAKMLFAKHHVEIWKIKL